MGAQGEEIKDVDDGDDDGDGNDDEDDGGEASARNDKPRINIFLGNARNGLSFCSSNSPQMMIDALYCRRYHLSGSVEH